VTSAGAITCEVFQHKIPQNLWSCCLYFITNDSLLSLPPLVSSSILIYLSYQHCTGNHF
jgi:hypothetical protein